MPARSYGDALAYYLKTNNRKDAPAVQGAQVFTALWLAADSTDANLSTIRLPGGFVARGVQKHSSVTGLSPNDPIIVTIQPNGLAQITGKSLGNAGLALPSWAVAQSAVPPSQPGAPTIGSPTTTSVALSWTASTDNSGTGIAGYTIFESTLGLVGTSITNSFTVTGLTAGTSYTFKVQGRDNTGALSLYSNNGTGSTSGFPAYNPSSPISYTYSYAATWSGSYNYDGGGEYDPFLATQCWQGRGDGNNTTSLIGFNSTKILADASGYGVPVSAAITLTYGGWTLKDGGIAEIGTHQASARVANLSLATYTPNLFEVGTWKAGQRIQVPLGVGIAGDILAGTTKGVCLGPGPSTDAVYAGFAYGALTGANQPVLTITFLR